MAFNFILDPLSAVEIKHCAALIYEYFNVNFNNKVIRFNTITLNELEKSEVIKILTGDQSVNINRSAKAIVQVPAERSSFLLSILIGIPISDSTVISCERMDELLQPLLTIDDCLLVEEICKQDENVRKVVLERYGISDMSLIVGDPWSIHIADKTDEMLHQNKRLVQLYMYHRLNAEDNHYSHPLDIVPIVDLDDGTVVRLDIPSDSTAVSIPTKQHNYTRHNNSEIWRHTLKPLQVIQPDGPSFRVSGRLVEWDNWSFRVGFNYREGLVIHQLTNDGQPIAYRMSLVEMAVPYGDVNPPFHRKCAFDAGDYGLGFCANSLSLGCDCLGEIYYFDAILNNSKGEPFIIPNAICLHEEDNSILWKHVEYRTGHAEVRRSRKLVISFIATVVNYEYAFYWSFFQDGHIEFEIKLTGIISTNVPSIGEDPTHPLHGTLVSPLVNSQYHQHLFNVRLDMAIGSWLDGNTVKEIDIIPCELDPIRNPFGNGFICESTPLLNEMEGIRSSAPEKGRSWSIENPHITNEANGSPIAYKLIPDSAGGPLLLAHPSSVLAKRAAFATKSLWVTPYSPDENFPAGEFTIMSKGGEGLEKFTAANRSIENKDLVLWHSFGVTHIPRPEDFPVMPAEKVGFRLKPAGFFPINPSINIPPNPKKCHFN